MADFDKAINTTLSNEGGAKYTKDPTDRGGDTKWGISQKSYPHLNIANLTEQDAKEIYKRDYWDRVNGDKITDQDVAEKIFDMAVNMGVRTVSKMVQSVVDIHPVDGVIGDQSISMINKKDKSQFLAALLLVGIARYVAICNKDRSQSKYLLGWLNRVLS